jgi:hypothetical protein
MSTNLTMLRETPGFDQHYSPRSGDRSWLSISALCEFARCPRKFFYRFGCDLTPAGGEHIALKFGEAIHAGVGILLGQLTNQQANQASLDKAYAKFMTVWEDRDKHLDEKRNSITARFILLNFMNTHQPGMSLYEILEPPKSTLKVQESVSDYEVPFAIDIGLPVPLVGRIDGLARHRDTKKLVVLEFKTCSQMSDLLFSGFRINPQNLGYALAVRSYGDELPGYYGLGSLDEVFDDFIHVPKPLKTKPTVYSSQLIPVHIQDHLLEAFLEWARYHGSRLLEMEQNRSFPRFPSGCHPYAMFGSLGYPCDYMNLCSVPDWTVMKDFYAVAPHNPYKLAPEVLKEPERVSVTLNGQTIGAD